MHRPTREQTHHVINAGRGQWGNCGTSFIKLFGHVSAFKSSASLTGWGVKPRKNKEAMISSATKKNYSTAESRLFFLVILRDYYTIDDFFLGLCVCRDCLNLSRKMHWDMYDLLITFFCFCLFVSFITLVPWTPWKGISEFLVPSSSPSSSSHSLHLFSHNFNCSTCTLVFTGISGA